MMLSTIALTAGLLFLLAVGYRYLMRQTFMLMFAVSGLFILLLNAGSISLQTFTWVKISSLSFAIAVAWVYTRSSGTLRKNLGITVWGLLQLNVFEAVLLDVASAHYMNAAVGFSLMASQTGPSRISQSLAGRPSLRYDLPWCWVLTYTIWNLSFVCANFPLRLFDHCAVLAAPLIAALCLRDRQRWLEARCFTLATYLICNVLIIDVLKRPWIAPAENAQAFYAWLVAVAVVSAAVNLVVALRVKRAAAASQALVSW